MLGFTSQVWAEVIYTLDTSLEANQSTSNGYNQAADVTVDGITWNVTGNSTMSPWRIGGKSIANTDRAVFSQTAFGQGFDRIALTLGTSSLTINSIKLLYSANSDFSNASTIVAESTEGSSTIYFEPSNGFVKDLYFKFILTLTNSDTKNNKFVQFSKVEFIKGAISQPDPEPTYTVTLSDDTSNPITQGEAGSAVTLPTRTGDAIYTFVGWSTTNYGNTESTTTPESIYKGNYTPTADITLYPIYVKYTGGNGGKFLSESKDGVTYYLKIDGNATSIKGEANEFYWNDKELWGFDGETKKYLSHRTSGSTNLVINSEVPTEYPWEITDNTSKKTVQFRSTIQNTRYLGYGSGFKVYAATHTLNYEDGQTAYYVSSFTETKLETSLAWTSTAATATMGEANTYPTLSKTPADIYDISYSSSNTSVAIVDENTGTITLVGAGKTIITASFAGDYAHQAAEDAKYTLTVIGIPEGTETITYNFNDLESYPEGFPVSSGTAAQKQTFSIGGNDLIINASSYYIINSGTVNKGLIFGKSVVSTDKDFTNNAYIAFPTIEGKKLTKVVATTTATGGAVKINIFNKNWEAQSTECTTVNSSKQSFTFVLEASYANTEYRLAVAENNKNLQLDNIILTYSTSSESGDDNSPKYTVTFIAGSGSCDVETLTEGSNDEGITLPNALGPDDEWEFKGWATTAIEETTDRPDLKPANYEYHPTKNETLYAVYGRTQETGRCFSYTETFAAGKKYIFASKNTDGKAHVIDANQITGNATKSISSPTATVIVNDGEKIFIASEPNETSVWYATGTTSSLQLKNGDFYLAVNGDGVSLSSKSSNLYWNNQYGLYGKSGTGATSYYFHPGISINATTSETNRMYMFVEDIQGITTYATSPISAPLITPTIAFTESEDKALFVGDKYTNTATVQNSTGAITYSSSNTDIAFVNESTGEVTAKSVGEAIITARVAAVENVSKPKEVSYKVTVTEAALTKIEVKTAPTTKYKDGDVFSLEGLKLTATYENNKTRTISEGITVIPDGILSLSDTEVTLSYTENEVTQTCPLSINVLALDHISITTDPSKTDYLEGENIDLDGIVVTAVWGTGETTIEEAITDFDFDKDLALRPTYTSFEISYTHKGITKAATFEITVTGRAKYDVTLNINGFETIVSEDIASLGIVIPTPSNIGNYSFAGWSLTKITEETQTKPTFVATNGKYFPTEPTTLYAVYEINKEVDVNGKLYYITTDNDTKIYIGKHTSGQNYFASTSDQALTIFEEDGYLFYVNTIEGGTSKVYFSILADKTDVTFNSDKKKISAWEITTNENGLISFKSSACNRYLGYNKTSPRFAAYLAAYPHEFNVEISEETIKQNIPHYTSCPIGETPEIALTSSKNLQGWKTFYNETKHYIVDNATTIYTAIQMGSEAILVRPTGSNFIPAGTPILLKTTAPDYTINLMEIEETDKIDGENILKVATGGETDAYILACSNTKPVAFYRYNDPLDPGDVYIPAPAGAASLRIVIEGISEEETAIDQICETTEENAIFNLSGIRIQKAKGLVIKNGKIMLVK